MPRSPSAATTGEKPRMSRQVSPSASVGSESYGTRAACSASVTSGSERNARTFSRRIR